MSFDVVVPIKLPITVPITVIKRHLRVSRLACHRKVSRVIKHLGKAFVKPSDIDMRISLEYRSCIY